MVVIVYTGTGPGKTTAALGIALRSLAHGKRVTVVQFLKWERKTGEYLMARKLGSRYTIRQFGRKGWIGLKNLGPEDRKLALKGLSFAERELRRGVDLLILDEVNLAVHCKLLRPSEVLELIKKAPEKTVLILTGRYAPPPLTRVADVVVEVKEKKFSKRLKAVEGLNF